MEKKFDVLILGAGLAGSLAALKLASSKPDLKIALIEANDHIGGHHTWTFHESDLPPDAMEWIRPLLMKTWERSTVRFPKIEKTTEGRFHLIRSEDLHRVVKDRLGDGVILKARVDRATESQAVLENGDVYNAELVLDARGLVNKINLTGGVSSASAGAPVAPGVNGYHKSIGYDLVLTETHGLTAPVLIDATCPQLDGFRYYSLLPLNDKTLYAQETYYSDAPDLNAERISRSLESYAERRGWQIAKRERQEVSSVPMPMTSEYLSVGNAGEALPIGMRGGYYHATTTNAFPDAVKVAEFLATAPGELSTTKVRESLTKWRRPWLSRQRFYRLLNRFLYFASEPTLRYLVLQNLFEQPTDVVSRYTGGRTSWGDRLRILSGRPPLPFDLTLKSFSERAVLARNSEA